MKKLIAPMMDTLKVILENASCEPLPVEHHRFVALFSADHDFNS